MHYSWRYCFRFLFLYLHFLWVSGYFSMFAACVMVTFCYFVCHCWFLFLITSSFISVGPVKFPSLFWLPGSALIRCTFVPQSFWVFCLWKPLFPPHVCQINSTLMWGFRLFSERATWFLSARHVFVYWPPLHVFVCLVLHWPTCFGRSFSNRFFGTQWIITRTVPQINPDS